MLLSSLIVPRTSLSSASSFSISRPGELGQAHVEDGVALLLGEREALAKPRVGVGHVLRLLDDLDDLVDVVDGDLETLEDVLPGLGRLEIELGPAHDDVVPVLDEALEQLLQVHDLRRAVIERQHDHAEGGLHRGVLVELVQHYVGDGVALELDDEPHAVLVDSSFRTSVIPSIFRSIASSAMSLCSLSLLTL